MTDRNDREYAAFHRRMVSELVSLRSHSQLLDACKGTEAEPLAIGLKDMLSYLDDDGILQLENEVSFKIPQHLIDFARAAPVRDQREIIWRLAKCISKDGGSTSVLDDAVRLDKSPKTLYRGGGSGNSSNVFSAETTITHIAALLHSLETLADASSGGLEYEFVGVKMFATFDSVGSHKSYGIAALAPMVAELSMKLLIDHCSDKSVPRGRDGHDLLILWRSLSAGQREAIEGHYRNRQGDVPGSAEDACRDHRRTYVWWRYPGDTTLTQEFPPLDVEVLRALAWATYAAAVAGYREAKAPELIRTST